jgi:hypothetical protein
MLYKCTRPLAIGVLGELCVRSRHGACSLLAPATKQAVDVFYLAESTDVSSAVVLTKRKLLLHAILDGFRWHRGRSTACSISRS